MEETKETGETTTTDTKGIRPPTFLKSVAFIIIGFSFMMWFGIQAFIFRNLPTLIPTYISIAYFMFGVMFFFFGVKRFRRFLSYISYQEELEKQEYDREHPNTQIKVE
jgi:hypothetical protein